VDGCRGGWIVVARQPSGAIEAQVYESFATLLSDVPCGPIAIDIPIGLPRCGARTSDLLARQRLGPRRSSVFPAPPRAALTAASHAEACAIRRDIEGKGISAQTWRIFAKIADVDACMTPLLQERVVEAHPELCFTTMNGGAPSRYNKKIEGGRQERLAALVRSLPGCSAVIAAPRPLGCAADDLLDALAVLWTAERFAQRAAERLPATVERDECGLRMEIWY
jgi:predicted RNase H-like nuclease